MKGKYIKPSELLKLQQETGKSYWDLIGRPLGKKPKDPAKDVVDEYDPVYREALRMQIESALDYPQYKGGKSPKVKTWNDNDIADLIIGFEGFLPHAKDIGDGKITIGSGLTNPKYTRFGTITPEQNRRFVLEEIAARKARLSRNVPGWNTLPGSAKAALLSYDYGYMVDRKTSPKMMKALQDRNWLEVSNQMNAGWNMKKFKKGLRKRRTQERNLFLSDLYRPAPLKPIQTVSPMPEAKVPFEVNQMEDKIAPIVNQQQPIIPYTSTVELPQEYTIPENDMASIDLENTSRINPNDILQSYYNMFGYKRGKSIKTNPYSAGNIVDSIYKSSNGEQFLGEPSHHYDFTQSEEWANSHGYYQDERGHRDDRVKKPAHPTHPSRGKWKSQYQFDLSEKGIENPNYTMFGVVDGQQDPQATLTYNGSIVLPEITVTPSGNYIYNPYDNINILMNKYRRGKSFPFQFWNRAGNTMQLQR